MIRHDQRSTPTLKSNIALGYRPVNRMAKNATALTAAQSADGAAAASKVAVTYQTPKLIPFPGLTGQLTLTRTAEMRVRD